MCRRILVTTMLALAAAAEAAPTAEQKCEGGKNELAGKYAACRAKAEKKLALTGDATKYGEAIGKCESKYATGWSKLEAKATAAGGSCVDVVPENDLRDFVAACSDAVADVAAGGTLPAVDFCGNGAIDLGEDCDLGTLNGASCATEGFASGVLSCGSGCAFDTSGCYNARYVDNADGTITDNETGLMWEKKVKLDGFQDGPNLQDADNSYSWSGNCLIGGAYCQPDAASEAACLAGTEGSSYGCSQCTLGGCSVSWGITVWQWLGNLNTANFGGHSDWRLPKRAELLTLLGPLDATPPLVDAALHAASCGTMCVDVTSAACACTQSFDYWSASTYAPDTGAAWRVGFSDGTVNIYGKAIDFPLRAVRGGS